MKPISAAKREYPPEDAYMKLQDVRRLYGIALVRYGSFEQLGFFWVYWAQVLLNLH